MEEKRCPICGYAKSIQEFDRYFSKERNKFRIGNYCKSCARRESKKRTGVYFLKHKEERLQYARDYRANPENKKKIYVLRKKFKTKYREELKDCYVRDRLAQEDNIPNYVSREVPEIVETKRLQIKIKRKLKVTKNGKK